MHGSKNLLDPPTWRALPHSLQTHKLYSYAHDQIAMVCTAADLAVGAIDPEQQEQISHVHFACANTAAADRTC